jgi:hypothetical protein
MTAYRVYERLQKNARLRESAVRKTLEHLLAVGTRPQNCPTRP